MAIFLTLIAGQCTLKGLDARRHEGKCLHAAMQLQAMQTMEQMEWKEIAEQVEYVHHELHQLQDQNEILMQKVDWEQAQAQYDALRAQSLQSVAEQNEQKAQWMDQQVNATDQKRLALLKTIQEEVQTEQERLQQLHDSQFRSNFCDSLGISLLCDWMGDLTKLQRESDEADVQIHRDMEQLDEIDQQEYLQRIIEQAFQHQAQKYQRVADDLLRTASRWAVQATLDQHKLDALVQTTKALEQDTLSLEQQISRYEHSEVEMTDAVKRLLQDAHQYEKASEMNFYTSFILLVIPLVVFTLRCAAQLVNAVHRGVNCFQQKNPPPMELFQDVSLILLHGLFFLVTAFACRDYLANLEQYSTRKRCIVILYFACLGSLAQSLWLQVVPHVMYEQPWRTSRPVTAQIIWNIVKCFLKRLILLLPCFILEVLMLCLSPCRLSVLHPSDRMLYSVHAALVLGLLFYFLFPGPQHNEISERVDRDDHSTVNQDDSEDEVSVKEHTPLKIADTSLTDTELFPELHLAQMDDREERKEVFCYSADESSPYSVDFATGLRRLVFLAETFTLCYVLVNFNLIVTSLMPAQAQALRVVLCCFLAGLALFLAYQTQRHSASSFELRTAFEFGAKKIDV
ncbi:hypothetical protein FisN_26Lh029 [Fistulifera solaris]|uniref:Uncharacterized protein n=1 Tax=Fistulifera solaris TaxID=1519565 RepID=A0A1Z5KCX2_FISSO|nr:hypothetical protein FisN_26Lh029 [Fistulifera solaris]|eukprot:GAX23972.1 hypothetical protein FisN_26Lh029 [Fistulifera solaris]